MMRESKTILQHLRSLVSLEPMDAGIDEELQFHIEMRIEENINDGMTPVEAREDAMRRFGDFERVKQMCRTIDESGRGRTAKLCLWLVGAGWLAFWAISPKNLGVRSALLEAAAVGILLSLLSSVRHLRRAKFQNELDGKSFALFAEQSVAQGLKIEGALNKAESGYAFPHDEDGLTPVERLLRDE